MITTPDRPPRVGLAELTAAVTPELVARVSATLPLPRQDRLRRFRHPADRARGALADALALLMTAETTGLPLTEVTLRRTASGAPVLEVPDGEPTPHLSLTHAGRWVGCVLAHEPVGIDVEVVRAEAALRLAPVLPTTRITHLQAGPRADQGVLHTADLAADLAADLGAGQGRQAVRLWTAVESYLKLLGTGLAIDPRDVRLIHSWGDRVAALTPGRPAARVQVSDLDDDHVLAVARIAATARGTQRPQVRKTPAEVVFHRYLAARAAGWMPLPGPAPYGPAPRNGVLA